MKRTTSLVIFVGVVFALLAGSGAVSHGGQRPAPAGTDTAREEALRRYEAARANPANETARAAFLAGLPRVGDYYILEGDLRMTEDEILEYLIASSESARRPQVVTPELVVNLYRGQADFYPLARRTLTYFIDRTTFRNDAEFARVAQDLAQAAAEWEQACETCRVRFVRMMERSPAAPPNFVVRMFNAGGEFVAAAFFPHDVPARRMLDIDPSFFTTKYRPVGVLRHELGHVLGYRHEQVRGVRGCFREDRFWSPLTEYDAKSVMHYFCGGAGTRELELTHIDREGHRSLYQIVTATGAAPAARPAAAPPAPAAALAGSAALSESQTELVVSFEGGEVGDNAAAVLRVLNGLKVLPVRTHTIEKGDVVDTVFREHLGLPFHSKEMTIFAGELNKKDYLTRLLTLGETITLPALRFMDSTYGIRDNRQRAEVIEKNWDHLVTKGAQQQSDSREREQAEARRQRQADSRAQQSVRVEVRRFELRVPIADEKALAAAVARIHALPTKNVIATVERAQAGPAKYFSEPGAPPEQFNQDQFVKNAGQLKEGDQATMLSLLDDAAPGKRTCIAGKNCPEVVLVDTKVSMHPDLLDAVSGDDVDDTALKVALVANGRQTAELVEWEARFHATHLAGIIAARDNKFGVVGVDPDAHVTAWNWDTGREQRTRVAGDVSDRQAEADSRGSMQIYTFAGEWPAPAGATRETRISHDVLAKRFVEERPLVVVAAGQKNAAASAIEITHAAELAPANLGDQENVLVVTACMRCSGPGAAILAEANHSKEFVHIAAPGANVLSTAPGAKYSRGQGTSQATAFVAGLASLMAGRYPNEYGEAYQLKVRLQVTSTPFELVGSLLANRGLATGIVAPGVATLDPSKHWLKRNGVDRTEVPGRARDRKFMWTAEVLNLEKDGDVMTVPLRNVWRLVRLPGGDQWVAYVGSRRGPIAKVGPGRLAENEGAKVLFKMNGEDIKASMFEDLLLSFPSSSR